MENECVAETLTCDGRTYKCAKTAGQGCTLDTKCANTLVCDGTTNKCAKITGDDCKEDIDCANALVCDGTTEKCANIAGEDCSSNSECVNTLVCTCSECATGSKTIGDECKENECNTATLTCDIVTKKCSLIADQTCTLSSQCANALVCDATSVPTALKCAVAFAEDVTCTQNKLECGAGFTCDTTNTCAKETGETCTLSSECANALVCSKKNCISTR